MRMLLLASFVLFAAASAKAQEFCRDSWEEARYFGPDRHLALVGIWQVVVGPGATLSGDRIDHRLEAIPGSLRIQLDPWGPGPDFGHPALGELNIYRVGPGAGRDVPGVPLEGGGLAWTDTAEPGVPGDCDPRQLPVLHLRGHFVGGGQADLSLYVFGQRLLSGVLSVQSGTQTIYRLVTLHR